MNKALSAFCVMESEVRLKSNYPSFLTNNNQIHSMTDSFQCDKLMTEQKQKLLSSLSTLICTCEHIYTCICSYRFLHTHTYTNMLLHVHMPICTYTHIYIFSLRYTFLCTHIYKHSHRKTYVLHTVGTHIHIQTHTNSHQQIHLHHTKYIHNCTHNRYTSFFM